MITKNTNRMTDGAAVNVLDFGAVGDGVTDDTVAIQAALNHAASTGGTLMGIGNATCLVTSELSVSGGIKYDMMGDTIDGSGIANGTTYSEVAVLTVGGSIGSTVLLTSDVALGDQTLDVDSSSLAVGDYLLLSSSQLMVDGYSNPSNKRGELNRVEAITNGTSIKTAGGSLFAYATASSANIKLITPATGVSITNGKIIAGGVGSWHTGLRLDYCVDFKVENLDVSYAEDIGIATFYCYGGLIHGGVVEYSTNPNGGMAIASGTGYGTALLYATRDVVVDNVSYMRCKRAITGGARYPAVFNTVVNCVAEGGKNGLGSHEPCWWWTFTNNTVRGMAGVGFNIRGQYNKLSGNRIFDCAGTGIYVRTYYDNPEGITGTELTDNYLVRTAGIVLEGVQGRIIDTTISGGEIIDSNFNSLVVKTSDNVHIEGVRMSGQADAGSTDGNCVVVSGTVANGADNCTNVNISDCDMQDALRYGLKASYTQNLSIDGNRVGQSQREGLYLDGCERVSANNNKIKASVVAFTYGIGLRNCSESVVNNNHLNGNDDSGQTSNHGIAFIGDGSGNSCTDNMAVGNNINGHASAVLVTAINSGVVDHSVVVANNGRGCYGATKFNISSTNQSVANNLI